jgi:hypothetical protein
MEPWWIRPALAGLMLAFVQGGWLSALPSNRLEKAHPGTARADSQASPVSAALGAGGATQASSAGAPAGWMAQVQKDLAMREYEISWQSSPAVPGIEASWHAPNRAHGFRTYFTAEGIRVVPRDAQSASWRWGLSLVGYGEGGTAGDVERASLSPTGRRIDCRRSVIEESYENTPEGLEQRFILSAKPGRLESSNKSTGLAGWATPLRPRPAGVPGAAGAGEAELASGDARDSAAWVHLDLAIWGNLVPRISEDGQAIDFVTASGAPALHYAQLKVTDARGKRLPAWMEGFSGERLGGIRIVVDARHAIYPITIDPLTTSPAWTAESDQANAFFGYSVATAGDVNGDGFSDVIVGAPLFDSGQPDQGRAFVFHGSASGLSPTPNWTAESDQAGAWYGRSVGTAGDVNGDGFADVIVGAYTYDNGQIDEGRAFVYHGSAAGLSPTPSWTAESDQNSAWFGISVATAGDVNADGYDDVIVGAHGFDNGQVDEGRAFVYHGSASGLSPTPNWTAEGDQAGARFGNSVGTAGDMDGNGYSDVIIGAPFLDNGQIDEGAAFLYPASVGGLLLSPAWTAEGSQAAAAFGLSVSTAGDVNGDGYADLLVGAQLYDNGQTDEGRAFVYYGSPFGPSVVPDWTAESNQPNGWFANSVATAGDVNGDGYADIIVGDFIFDDGEVDEGVAFVYQGSRAGLSPTASWIAEGNQADARFGSSVATAGDVDGDGYSDVIVGAIGFDNGQTDEGRSFVYRGSAAGLSFAAGWTGESDQAGADFGFSVATAGDVNADGYSDVVVGAPFFDNGQTDEGVVFVYHGSATGASPTPDWTAESNQAGSQFGYSAATAGDVNGDGYADLIVGANRFDVQQSDQGRVFVYYGSPGGLSSTASWTADGNTFGGLFGICVAPAGDVNGDGFADVIVGASLSSPSGGRLFVYDGSPSGLSPTPSWTVQDPQPGSFFGWAVATAGDVNSDGYSDVIAGASNYDNGQTDEGVAFLYLGSATGLSQTPKWAVESNQAGAQLGYSVATAGDVNGDGCSAVVVGAPNYDNGETNEGRAFLYNCSATGLSLIPSWVAEGNQAGALFGFSVASAGDVNADGHADVIVGAYTYDNGQTDEGAAFLYQGTGAGLLPMSSWTAEGNQGGALFGYSVAPAGDVNGDGYADVVVGSYAFDNGQLNEGRAYLYYGGGGGGVRRIPRQSRTDGTTPIALLGKSDSETSFRLLERGPTPAGRGRVRLQWEVKPVGTPFNGSGLESSGTLDTGFPGTIGSAADFNEPVVGLAEGGFYHWRTRILSSDPFFPRSPWMSMPGNSILETKLRTAGCIDRDGDGYGALGDPSCPILTPDCNDANAALWDTPGEVLNLRFTSEINLAWDPPSAPGASLSNLVYDTLFSAVPWDFTSEASCLESDDGPNTTATDAATPPVGTVYFYLARAQNACALGTGSLGTDSFGAIRQGRTCP